MVGSVEMLGALHARSFYVLLPAHSYAWRRIPERTATHLIAKFPVAQIVSALVCWLLSLAAFCGAADNI